MEEIRKHVDKLFKTLPIIDQVKRAKEDMMEMLEDKYSDLIREGIDEEEAVKSIITEFDSIDEIKESLEIDKIIMVYKNSMNKEVVKAVVTGILLFILPILIIYMGAVMDVFVIGIITAAIVFGVLSGCICYFNFKYEKYKKLLETKVDKENTMIKYIIIAIVVAAISIINVANLSLWFSIVLIMIGIASYYYIKLRKGKLE